MITDQNAHETKMWLLWFHLSSQKMPSIWKDVCSVWKGQLLQGGLQKWEEQQDVQHRPGKRPVPKGR